MPFNLDIFVKINRSKVNELEKEFLKTATTTKKNTHKFDIQLTSFLHAIVRFRNDFCGREPHENSQNEKFLKHVVLILLSWNLGKFKSVKFLANAPIIFRITPQLSRFDAIVA